MAYEPPIKLIQMDDSMETMIQRAARLETEKIDGYVMECVHRVGVDINRTALIAAIEGDRQRYEQAYQEGLHDGMKRERIGHWIKTEPKTGFPDIDEHLKDRLYECSNCGKEIRTNGHDRTNKCLVAYANNPYCRWCGARMKPEEE